MWEGPSIAGGDKRDDWSEQRDWPQQQQQQQSFSSHERYSEKEENEVDADSALPEKPKVRIRSPRKTQDVPANKSDHKARNEGFRGKYLRPLKSSIA